MFPTNLDETQGSTLNLLFLSMCLYVFAQRHCMNQPLSAYRDSHLIWMQLLTSSYDPVGMYRILVDLHKMDLIGLEPMTAWL